MPDRSVPYSIIVPAATLRRAGDYARDLAMAHSEPGRFLDGQRPPCGWRGVDGLDLIGLLFDTRQPQIFAESAVNGDGSDWSPVELGLLGDVAVAVPVTIHDDGKHHAPKVHEPEFKGTLVFTAGALLRSDRGGIAADWAEGTTSAGELSNEGYYALYARRLLPVFAYINEHARASRSAFVTIPGLGCGQFAGPFRGQLEERLKDVLHRLLSEHGPRWPNIKAVYFDPYSGCQNQRLNIQGIDFMVRPLTAPGNLNKSQLCPPRVYAEAGDDFSECHLYSLVAWDHVSWPGNDFYAGARATDDGVKAAATDCMKALTGVEGRYDRSRSCYLPPDHYANWREVVEEGIGTGSLRLWHRSAVWMDEGSCGDQV